MANQITTAQDLKDVLDAIYNNQEQYDSYQTVQLFYNEITRTAKIFTLAEDNTETVIAIFNPENVVTTNNAFFCTLMKSTNFSGDEARVFDFGLGGYVGIDTLLKNICAALGVQLSDSFADANPQFYADMIAIIKNNYDRSLENQAPYIMKKTYNATTEESFYKSYVPLLCIVDIAIYLNNMGLFNVDIDKDALGYKPLSGYSFNTTSMSGNEYWGEYISKSFDYYNVPTATKNEFIEYVQTFYKDLMAQNDYFHTFEKLIEQYEPEIDWDNGYIRVEIIHTVFSDYTTESCRLGVMPKDKTLHYGRYFGRMFLGNYHSTVATVNEGAGFTSDGETERITFTMSATLNTGETEPTYTYNKMTLITPNGVTRLALFGTVTNLKQNGYYKLYIPDMSSSSDYRHYDTYQPLTENTFYDKAAIKTLGGEHLLSLFPPTVIIYLKENDLLPTNEDFVIAGNRKTENNETIYPLMICKNFQSIKMEGGMGLRVSNNGFLIPLIHKTTGVITKYTTYSYENSISASSWCRVSFEEETEIIQMKVIVPNKHTDGDIRHDIIKDESVTSCLIWYSNDDDKWFFGNYTTCDFLSNLGEWVEVQNASAFEGLTLQEGATYPKDVIDRTTFLNTYPDWLRTQSNNPQIIDGVMVNTVASTEWGAVSISKTTPTTQEDSVSGEINFDDQTIIDDIIDDTEKATEDEDTDTGGEPDKDNDVGGKNEGATPLPPADTDIVPVMGARVFAMSAGYAKSFLSNCMDETAWSAVAGLDPLKYIISLQATQSIDFSDLEPSIKTWKLMHAVYFNGAELSGTQLIVDYNFGQAYISPEYMNYNDVTSTTMSIYLPYVGYVDLDITDFLDRMIVLHAKVDLTNGNIIYYIGVNELGGDANSLQYIYQYTGNCHRNIPVSSETSVWLGLKNTFKLPVGKLD